MKWSTRRVLYSRDEETGRDTKDQAKKINPRPPLEA